MPPMKILQSNCPDVVLKRHDVAYDDDYQSGKIQETSISIPIDPNETFQSLKKKKKKKTGLD